MLPTSFAPVHIILSLPCGEQKGQNPPVKYWELVADKLSKLAGAGAASQRWIPRGAQSGLLTHIAATARRLRIQVSGRTVWIDQTFLQKG
jgi:hypothetical protein